ncbi:MAG: extracellular solute-binding protein [Eubacteriales bacterium]
MNKKRVLALLLATSMVFAMSACGSTESSTEGSTSSDTATTETTTTSGGVELVVVTSYGGDDGNQANFQAAYEAYEEASGNTVLDGSATANEEWKAKVMTDFETGSEPDVLFYFVGSDADTLVEGGKVVSIDTIREEYPEYASNMKDDLLPASSADGVKYAIPVNGYWEGMFVNETVLAEAGVEMPGADYTWDQFLADCEAIKEAGYTPIAASLQEVPHYWFEFVVYNQGTVADHTDVPETADDDVAVKWAAGLDSIKELYDLGYFPTNTLTATDAETVQLMIDDEAAFLIDGSWKISYFTENAADVENFSVTYVPGANDREATDIVGGLSMGYYITEKAWNDEAKRDAAVEFVMAMTTDEVVSTFGATAVTALTNGVVASGDLNGLELSAIDMTAGATGVAAATQDGISAEARGELFSRIQDIAVGNMTSLEAIESALSIQ